MKLRTQLVLGFLLLAVVPLSGLTLFSFLSSERALRQAVEAESTQAAREMGLRMEAVSRDLGSRIDQIGDLPFSDWTEASEDNPDQKAESEKIYYSVLSALGDSAGLVDSLEFAPAPEPPAPGPDPGGGSESHSPPGPPHAPPPPRVIFKLPENFVAPVPPPGRGNAPGVAASGHPRVVHAEGQTLVLPPIPGQLESRIEVQIEEALRDPRLTAETRQKAVEALELAQKAVSESLAGREAEAIRREFAIVLGGKSDAKSQKGKRHIRAELNAERVFQRVLTAAPAPRMWRTAAAPGEIPFAIDREGNLFTPRPEDRERLKDLELEKLTADGAAQRRRGDWVVVAEKDESSGLTLGIARPLAQPLADIRNAALRNLMVGLGLIGLALIGIVPLSNRISRNVETLSRGAEQLAAGDLKARVPVRSRDELGRLAETFNRMAHDLEQNQRELVQRQRLQKELELCRHIQEEMLPKHSLQLPLAEVKGVSIPASEVGGDFFNYFSVGPDKLAILIGDVSGKGVAAALLMANIQATLKARLPLAAGLDALAAELDEEIAAQTPPQTYLTLFMATLDLKGGVLRWVNAGHNPQYALRAHGGLTRMESGGRPLGLLPGGGFEAGETTLREGDSLFLFTDGLTEAADRHGEQFGHQRLEEILVRESGRDLASLLRLVEAAAKQHRQDAEPGDDATMVALKFGEPAEHSPAEAR